MPSLSLLTYLKITGIAAIIAVISLGYRHYTSLQDEIIAVRTDLLKAQEEARRAKSAIDALEQVATEKEVIVKKSVAFREKLTNVPEDIEIPGPLAKPFLERFGGAQ